jgi:CIC family chloride channel protein
MAYQKLQKFYHHIRHFGRTINAGKIRKYNLIGIVLIVAKRKLSRFQFLVISGVIVGFLGGLAGIVLKLIVHAIQFYLREDLPTAERIILFGFLPLIGILLTVLIGKYIYRNTEDIKLEHILNDIAHHDSNVSSKQMHMQLVQSALTIGLGGSAGLETPSAITGAAIGSNFAKRYRLGYKEKTLLLAGGAAAGVAAAFNAPVAGIMFSFEILLTGVIFSDFIPLVISAMCGSIITMLLKSDSILFNIAHRGHFNYSNLPYYFALAIIAGFYARYYNIINGKIHRLLCKFPYGSIKRALFGGLALSALCVAFPAVFAEGYVNLQMLEKGNTSYVVYQEVETFFLYSPLVLLIVLCLTLVVKPMATSFSLNSGGVGGNFAPSLVAGGLLGYAFAYALSLIGFTEIPITNLMLAGMAGVLSGVMYAPLTGIFLIAESSYGYDLLIPLMVVAVTSFLINKYFSPFNPAYSSFIRERKIFTTRLDDNILTQISTKNCMDEDNISISHLANLSTLEAKFSDSSKSIVAVVDEEGHFWGMLSKSEWIAIRKKERDLSKFSVADLAIHPTNFVIEGASIEELAQKFEESDVWYLPLIDENHRFIGFVSRFRFLKEYRKLLKNYSN